MNLSAVRNRSIGLLLATAGVLLAVALSGRAWLALFLSLVGAVIAGTAAVALQLREHNRADRWDRRIGGLAFGFCALFSLLMSVLIPPLQSPDEAAHLGRAYGVLQNEVLVRDLGGGANQTTDDGLQEYNRIWGSTLPFKAENQVTPEMEDASREQRWNGRQSTFYNPAALYFPALYAPASLGMDIARQLDQPPWVAASWARFGMWAAGMAMLWLALAVIQAGQRLMVATMLLPMSMAQFGSSNLDSTTIPGCFLLLSLYSLQFSSAFEILPGRMRAVAEASGLLLLALLAAAKPIFLVLLMLPAIAAWRNRRWSDLLASAVILLLVLLWQYHVAISFANPNPAVDGSPFARLADAIVSPWQTLLLLLRTFAEKGMFYWQSMVGILGWLDTPLLKPMYASATILLAAALASDMLRAQALHGHARVAFATAFTSYAVGTMLLLWVSWTPVGHPFVEGVQGRYFLPLLPALGMSVSGVMARFPGAADWSGRLFFAYLLVYVSLITVDVPSLLIVRYWL